MPRYGGRELARKGLKGGSTGLPDDPGMRAAMPEVLFQPQITGPVNRANCRPVEPTPCYDADDMPTFRPIPSANDAEGPPQGWPRKPAAHHPYDWR